MTDKCVGYYFPYTTTVVTTTISTDTNDKNMSSNSGNIITVSRLHLL